MYRRQSNEDLATIVRSSKPRPIRKWLLITTGVLLLGAGTWFAISQLTGKEDLANYVTEPASIGRISLVVTASGNLAPINQVVIGSELSGTIDEVLVDTNDMVKKHQPLAKLDTSKLTQQTERSRAALLAAKAKVTLAKATLEETKAAFARQQELHKLSNGKTPSRATMEASHAAVSRAEAELENTLASVAGAEAEVRAYERDLEKAIIRSPVDGVVLTRTVEVGQTVAASFTAPTLFTIAEDLKKMELLVSVTEADIGRVKAGQSATFSVDAWPQRSYSAVVKKVAFGSSNNQSTGSASSASNSANSTGLVTYSTELEVTNDDLSLRPGMTATVDIAIVDKQNILTVPNAALRFDPEIANAAGKTSQAKRTLVQSLTPGGRRWRGGSSAPKTGIRPSYPCVYTLVNNEPTEVPVTPGITDGRITEITDDSLKADTPVIISIKPKADE